MSEFGFVATESGTSITASADYQHIIDSRFLGLQIIQEGDFTISDVTAGTLTVASHNLGYTPFWLVWAKRSVSGGYFLNPTKDNDWNLDFNSKMDTQSLYINANAFEPAFPGVDLLPPSLHYMIFSISIDKSYSSPEIQDISLENIKESKYGIEVAKPTKDVNSKDMRDFAINSRSRGFSVATIAYGGAFDSASGLNKLTATHNLGYSPVVLSILRDSQGRASMNNYLSHIDSQVAYLTISNPPPFSIVVLKNPIDPKELTVTQVSYG